MNNIFDIYIFIIFVSSRRSSSNYRRSSSRRSITRGPVPVDKLLFLRHRAKENMKYGMHIYTGWPISSRTKYFRNFVLIHHRLGLIFKSHILDDINHRCSI